MSNLREENVNLRGMFVELRRDLDKQTDRSLRDHLVFYGVAGRDKTWVETEDVLAESLAKNVGGNKEKYVTALTRTHRGAYNPGKPGPRPIFAKMDFNVAEEVRNKTKLTITQGVTVRDQFSKNMQKRVNEALLYRKKWKNSHPSVKAFISYPATLKTKEFNDSNYKVE